MKKYITYNKFVRNTIFISFLTVVSLFVLYGIYIQSNSIEKSMKKDTKIISDLIFQNLYTVMKNGGDISTINNTIQRLEKDIPHVNIKIIRNIDDSKTDIVKNTFETKRSNIIRNDDKLNFTMPILYKNECLSCHTNGKAGNIAAVTFIEQPILELKITLKEILLMASILFILVITVFFSFWYYFLSKYFVSPIKDLINQISKNSNHNALKNKISIKSPIKEIKYLETSFNKQNWELLKSYKKLEKQSNTDALTGIYNRKKFDEYTEIFLNEAKRYKNIFSLLVIDLNKFKPINDTYGHDIGDKVLIFFTKTISNLIRESDFFFRTGGDEFVLLLPNTNYKQAQQMIKKIKKEFEQIKFQLANLELEITASYGIYEYALEIEDISSMIKIADEEMYKDKEKYGRK